MTNRPAIDGDGNVAFWARTAETFLYDFGNDFADFFPIEGIFTGPDLSADRVIGTGDPLFGSTVALTRPTNSLRPINTWLDMNDSGQIAFRYQLADGRRGIAVATPLPEPGSALLLAAGAVVLMKRTRRR